MDELTVQALPAELVFEAFRIADLPWTARINMDGLDPPGLDPLPDRRSVATKLRKGISQRLAQELMRHSDPPSVICSKWHYPSRMVKWPGRQDLNLRPLHPQRRVKRDRIAVFGDSGITGERLRGWLHFS